MSDTEIHVFGHMKPRLRRDIVMRAQEEAGFQRVAPGVRTEWRYRNST